MTASSSRKNPILVTGAHRSGTTWVGKMLAADKQTIYVGEPLNVNHPLGIFDKPVPHWYTYICDDNGDKYRPTFDKMLNFEYALSSQIGTLKTKGDLLRTFVDQTAFLTATWQNRKAVIKDPFAVFSIPWLLKTFSCNTVIMVRHPAAFVSSLKYLHWLFDFQHLLEQPLLMRDWLEPYRAEMKNIKNNDIVGQASLLWTLIYGTVHKIAEQYPEILVLRHEDISQNPLESYRNLYKHMGLKFSLKAQSAILASSSTNNPKELNKKTSHLVSLNSRANIKNWQHRLSSDEIRSVKERTTEIANLYYDDKDWN